MKRRWTGESFKGFPFYESLGWMLYPVKTNPRNIRVHLLAGRPLCQVFLHSSHLTYLHIVQRQLFLQCCLLDIRDPSQLVFQWGHALNYIHISRGLMYVLCPSAHAAVLPRSSPVPEFCSGGCTLPPNWWSLPLWSACEVLGAKALLPQPDRLGSSAFKSAYSSVPCIPF